MSYGNPSVKNRVFKAIPRASQSAGTVNGTGFPTAGFKTALCILDLGTLGTSATVDVKFQESDTLGGTYTDIAGAVFAQKVKASHDDWLATGCINLQGKKAFIRAVSTVGAASSVVGVHVVMQNPDRDERVYAAQHASGAVSGPNSAGALEFQGV